MPSKKRKYEARFPPARIKKIMQTDEEIGKVAAAVPVIISRSLEIFLQSLVETTAQYTNERKAKTMTTSHLKHCIENEGKFDFLKDLVVNIADIANPDEEEGNETGEKPKKPRKPRQTNTEKKKKKKESSSSEESDAQSDGEESGSAQTSFPSSPNPSGNMSNLPLDIPPINIPPINIPPLNIPPISISMDPISKPSNSQSGNIQQQGASSQRNSPAHSTLQSPRNAQVSHGVQSPRNVHSPLSVLSPQGMPSPQAAQSPQAALSPRNAPSPRAAQSPRASQSPRGSQSPMEVAAPNVTASALNVPSPLVSSPRNMPSPRNIPSPLYVPETHPPQTNTASASKVSPLVPQAPSLNQPLPQACSPNPATGQKVPPQGSQMNAPMPMMDGINTQEATQKQTPPPLRPSHSIDAIMGNVGIPPAPSQQQFQLRPFQQSLHSSAISSNFMPNFNLQGNGKSAPPTVTTSFRPNFSAPPFQVTNEDEDDDYDT